MKSACTFPLSTVFYTVLPECTCVQVLHVPSIHSPKCFCSMCEVASGFIMLLPSRRTHQGQEHLNKGEWQTWKDLIRCRCCELTDWKLMWEKSAETILMTCSSLKSLYFFLISHAFSFNTWQYHLEWRGLLCQQTAKNTYLLIRGPDLLPSPRQQHFLKKQSLRLMLWIKASVILRVDITVEKEIERIARDQISNDQNQIKSPRWRLRLKSGGLDII